MPVKGGEGLVEQKKLRIADQDAGQGDALLLPAGELVRLVVLQPFKLHEGDHLGSPPLFYRVVLLSAQAAEDVLPHGHIRKKGVILE